MVNNLNHKTIHIFITMLK